MRPLVSKEKEVNEQVRTPLIFQFQVGIVQIKQTKYTIPAKSQMHKRKNSIKNYYMEPIVLLTFDKMTFKERREWTLLSIFSHKSNFSKCKHE